MATMTMSFITMKKQSAVYLDLIVVSYMKYSTKTPAEKCFLKLQFHLAEHLLETTDQLFEEIKLNCRRREVVTVDF